MTEQRKKPSLPPAAELAPRQVHVDEEVWLSTYFARRGKRRAKDFELFVVRRLWRCHVVLENFGRVYQGDAAELAARFNQAPRRFVEKVLARLERYGMTHTCRSLDGKTWLHIVPEACPREAAARARLSQALRTAARHEDAHREAEELAQASATQDALAAVRKLRHRRATLSRCACGKSCTVSGGRTTYGNFRRRKIEQPDCPDCPEARREWKLAAFQARTAREISSLIGKEDEASKERLAELREKRGEVLIEFGKHQRRLGRPAVNPAIKELMDCFRECPVLTLHALALLRKGSKEVDRVVQEFRKKFRGRSCLAQLSAVFNVIPTKVRELLETWKRQGGFEIVRALAMEDD